MNNDNNKNNMNQNNSSENNKKSNQTNKDEKTIKNKQKENISESKSEGTSQEQKDTEAKTEKKSSDNKKSDFEYHKKVLKEANINIDEIKKILNLEDETEENLFSEASLTRVRIFLSQINEIRIQLARLDTNLAGTVYYENEVFPILNILFLLAAGAGDYSLVARNLAQISFAKTSKVKDIIDLTYDIDKLSEIVFESLEYKIKKLLRILGR